MPRTGHDVEYGTWSGHEMTFSVLCAALMHNADGCLVLPQKLRQWAARVVTGLPLTRSETGPSYDVVG